MVYGQKTVKTMHINCLELLAVPLALKHCLPQKSCCHVFSQIRQHNSGCLYKQTGGHPLKKSTCPSEEGNDMEQETFAVPQSDAHSRPNEYRGRPVLGNPHPGEWRIHPLVVLEIWDKYGQARVDLSASKENTPCPPFFSLREKDVPLGMH